jgi:hypothetical protein
MMLQVQTLAQAKKNKKISRVVSKNNSIPPQPRTLLSKTAVVWTQVKNSIFKREQKC